jgi:hypothetical protein
MLLFRQIVVFFFPSLFDNEGVRSALVEWIAFEFEYVTGHVLVIDDLFFASISGLVFT